MAETLLLDCRTTPPSATPARIEFDFCDEKFWEVESAWAPERERLPFGVEHSHWNWIRKIGTSNYRFVAVTRSASVEGLMAISRKASSSQLVPGDGIIHIDFIEVAPWNLPAYPDGVRFRGVGKSLLAAAVQVGVEAGFQGRVGLGSLPQATGFYRHCGMTSLGEQRGLVYFEYRSADAVEFLVRSGQGDSK